MLKDKERKESIFKKSFAVSNIDEMGGELYIWFEHV